MRASRGVPLRLLLLGVVATGVVSRVAAQEVMAPSGSTAYRTEHGPTFFAVVPRTGERVDARNSAVLQQRIAIALHEATVDDALDAIASRSGLQLNYSRSLIPADSRITLAASEISVGAALTAVLLNAGLDVQMTGPSRATLVEGSGPPLVAEAKHRDPHRLTGRVVDAETKAPVPGATVLVTGTTIGTTTSDSGVFAVVVPTGATSLTVRRIGYRQETVPLPAAGLDVTVELARDVLHLEQQVVTGVATSISSKNSANAVGVVSSDQVNGVPSPTIDNAMQAKVPGVLIAQNNGGAPGGGMQIQIRGITSINATASPLYVVDGIMINNETVNPGTNAISLAGPAIGQGAVATNAPSPEDNGANRIADLNPEDIESIEILKGASASAIYGSKASSGVVIITTKKGTAGKPKWELTQKVGHFSDEHTLALRTFPTLASAVAWGKTFGYAPAAIAGVYAGPQDFQSQLFSNPQASYETDASVGGLADHTQYFLSVLSKYDNGIMTNTGYNKQSVRANFTQRVGEGLTASANLMYAHSLTRRGFTGNDNNGGSPYDVFSYTPQFVNLARQGPDGSWPVNPFGPANAFADAAEIQTPEDVGRFIGGGTVDWQAFTTAHQSLRLTVAGGADLTSQRDQEYAPPTLQLERTVPNGLPGVATLQNDQTNYLNYSINVVHHYTPSTLLDATTSFGFVRERRTDNNPEIVAQNLQTGVNAPTAGSFQQVFFSQAEALDQSLYAQEQLITLRDRLSLTAGVTAERSTNDGDIRHFYAFPRYSVSYRVPAFAGFLDELKVRAAYGQSGTQPSYGVKYSPFAPMVIDQTNGIYANALRGDSLIRPEAETEIETGIDATMLKSRAQFSVTVYQKRIQDLLLQASVAPSRFYAQQWFNGGEFTNQGIELSLSATPIQNPRGLTWVSSTTFYRNYSVVNSLPVSAFSFGNTFSTGSAYLQPGRSVSQIVNPNVLGSDNQPVQVGDFQPSFVMDFSEEFTYRGFRLSGLLDWHRGGNTINLTELYFDAGPGLEQDLAAGAARLADFGNGLAPYVDVATFLKLRELSLSYAIPDRWIGWIAHGRVNSARLALTGRNLWSSFRYNGLDPEVSVFGNQNVTTSQDVTPYPPARSVFLSLDVAF